MEDGGGWTVAISLYWCPWARTVPEDLVSWAHSDLYIHVAISMVFDEHWTSP